jgi:hypothetical protein
MMVAFLSKPTGDQELKDTYRGIVPVRFGKPRDHRSMR